MQIKKQLVSQNVINQRSYGSGNPKKFITIHQTGNPNKGANAQAHAKIQSNLNPREASWHYQVDDKEVIQSFEDNIKCWHSGDGKGPGNTESIGIEICINEDGDYKKAIDNAAELVKYLMKKHNIPVANIRQHYHWSKKHCPAQIRDNYKGISWTNFINLVEKEDKPKSDVHTVKSGDTLWAIAKAYDTTVAVLRQINGLKGNLIHPGDKIKLPSDSKPIQQVSLKVGSKVKVKSSASKYATGQSIPNWVKGKTYTIQQVKTDRVLLKEILSWVFKKDVQ